MFFLFLNLLVWQKRTSPPHVQNSIVALGFETKIKHPLSFIGIPFIEKVIHGYNPYPSTEQLDYLDQVSIFFIFYPVNTFIHRFFQLREFIFDIHLTYI